jgi:DNA primase
MSQSFTEFERDKIVDLAHQTLWEKSEESEKMLAYLYSRHLDDSTIGDFKLGLCPSRSNVRWISGRLIMPLFDAWNNCVAVTTRSIEKESSNRGHWHESFEKKYELFGINVAAPHIYEKGYAIVCEGQFDAMHMHACGFKNTVALLGSKMSMEQFASIARWCDEILLAFDSDDAGNLARKDVFNMLRGKSMMGTRSIKIRNIYFSGAKDPDEFISHFGCDHMATIIEKTRSKK